MGKGQQSSPPGAGAVELAERSAARSGGGDVECNSAIMKQRARKLRKEATAAERVLWSRLRRRQLFGYKFRRQQPMDQFIVDFVCLEKRLVVEVDGSQHNEQQSYGLGHGSVHMWFVRLRQGYGVIQRFDVR